jgi:hypothetical protein
MLAKAVSGMTNADGGVLVIGMKAESKPKDEPDVGTGAAPVADTSLVKSRVLGLDLSSYTSPRMKVLRAAPVRTLSSISALGLQHCQWNIGKSKGCSGNALTQN